MPNSNLSIILELLGSPTFGVFLNGMFCGVVVMGLLALIIIKGELNK